MLIHWAVSIIPFQFGYWSIEVASAPEIASLKLGAIHIVVLELWEPWLAGLHVATRDLIRFDGALVALRVEFRVAVDTCRGLLRWILRPNVVLYVWGYVEVLHSVLVDH